jgi:hypothetical protein
MVGVHHPDQILGLTCIAEECSIRLLNGFLTVLCLWKYETTSMLAVIAADTQPLVHV